MQDPHHETAASKASISSGLVRPTDVAIFDCPCCSQAVGIRRHKRRYIVRYHKHANGSLRCVFAGAKKVGPLVMGGVVRQNV